MLKLFFSTIYSIPFLLFSYESEFLVYDLQTDKWIEEIGTQCDMRFSPCSTFKIPLSLMGFDSEILHDKATPQWTIEKDPQYFWTSDWKGTCTAELWLKNSNIPFSRKLTQQLGYKSFNDYICAFEYGNRDTSGNPGLDDGLVCCWLNSSLTISPREQIFFLKKMLLCALPVSSDAVQMTKSILPTITLENGITVHGKTGSGTSKGWYIGWYEKENAIFLFAMLLHDNAENESLNGRDAMCNVLNFINESSAS